MKHYDTDLQKKKLLLVFHLKAISLKICMDGCEFNNALVIRSADKSEILKF